MLATSSPRFTQCFSDATFKESAGLPRAYCLEFLSQKLRNPKCLYYVSSRVFCQGNLEIHESQSMPVAIYSHSLFPDSTG